MEINRAYEDAARHLQNFFRLSDNLAAMSSVSGFSRAAAKSARGVLQVTAGKFLFKICALSAQNRYKNAFLAKELAPALNLIPFSPAGSIHEDVAALSSLLRKIPRHEQTSLEHLEPSSQLDTVLRMNLIVSGEMTVSMMKSLILAGFALSFADSEDAFSAFNYIKERKRALYEYFFRHTRTFFTADGAARALCNVPESRLLFDDYIVSGDELRSQRMAPKNTDKKPYRRTTDPAGEPRSALERLHSELSRGGAPGSRRDEQFRETAEKLAEITCDEGTPQPYQQYFPSYRGMTWPQFLWYFTWRTKVRAGEFPAADASYVLLYAYEIVNRIGAVEREDGLSLLISLWSAYRTDSPQTDRPLIRFIRDYAVYYNLPGPYRTLVETAPEASDCLKYELLTEFYTLPDEETRYFSLLELLPLLIDYNVGNSRFVLAGNGPLLEDCLRYTLRSLERNQYERRQKQWSERMLVVRPRVWRPFDGAPFAESAEPETELRPDPLHIYRYIPHERRWHCTMPAERTAPAPALAKQLGGLVRLCENILRRRTAFPEELKEEQIPDTLRRFVVDAVEKFYDSRHGPREEAPVRTARREPEKPVPEPVRIELDTERLSRLRDETDALQSRLIAEMESAVLPVEVPEEAEQAAEDSTGDPQADFTVEALEAILAGGEPIPLLEQIAKRNFMLYEQLLEAVNEAFFEELGDTILDTAARPPAVFDEYRDMAEEIVRRNR